MWETPELPFPVQSRARISVIKKEGRRRAFERALQSRFFAGRLDHVNLEHLHEPEEWAKVPILTKDELRQIPPADFQNTFCIQPRNAIIEFWRSGGSTGQPLLYPRTINDLRFAREGFRRAWEAAGVTKDDLAHVSFPLGIHPVGQIYCRTAQQMGIGVNWCGAGNSTPSEVQVELIRTLKPTVWCGMASYGLQLAQVSERMGFDLAKSSVKTFLTAAEPVSQGKRERIEALWGAELYDQFGCTEGSFMASESSHHDGMHYWTDMFDLEVLDEKTGEPVGEGENGILVMTPYWNNEMTPFLRWETGDYVSYIEKGKTDGPLSVYPMIRHAARTSGFLKVRGVNINHADFEDFMNRRLEISDFKVEVEETDTLDTMVISVELARNADADKTIRSLNIDLRRIFEVTPEITTLQPGTLEKEFKDQLKQQRFIDKRG
ncbi:MAG: AMP-binding protein [Pseudomonadota bacterium]|nr:AMP-binding protein [Pseudomonadota bacterium]